MGKVCRLVFITTQSLGLESAFFSTYDTCLLSLSSAVWNMNEVSLRHFCLQQTYTCYTPLFSFPPLIQERKSQFPAFSPWDPLPNWRRFRPFSLFMPCNRDTQAHWQGQFEFDRKLFCQYQCYSSLQERWQERLCSGLGQERYSRDGSATEMLCWLQKIEILNRTRWQNWK